MKQCLNKQMSLVSFLNLVERNKRSFSICPEKNQQQVVHLELEMKAEMTSTFEKMLVTIFVTH